MVPTGGRCAGGRGAAPCGFQGAGFDFSLISRNQSESILLLSFRNDSNYSTATPSDDEPISVRRDSGACNSISPTTSFRTGGPEVLSHPGGVPHHAGFACGAFDFRPLGLTPDRFSGLLLLAHRTTNCSTASPSDAPRV